MQLYRCNLCTEVVDEEHRREHLAGHNPNADGLSAEEIDEEFSVKDYGYEEALAELEQWGDLSPTLPAEQIAAIGKAKQALRDCLEMGLIGEGE